MCTRPFSKGPIAFLLFIAVFSLSGERSFAQTEKVLHSFPLSSSPGGTGPSGNLVFDAAGNLYGTTVYGGTGSGDDCLDGSIYGCGTAYELSPKPGGGWTQTVIHNFGNVGDGGNPEAGMILDAAGNLYGTTAGGGAKGCGTVFELSPGTGGTWTETLLHSFCADEFDGTGPLASLVFDSAGNLYGTTSEGGTTARCSCGIAFELSPGTDGSWTETVLHNFGGAGGSGPLAALIFDSAGNLYGTTASGGSSTCDYGFGCGVVFELVKAGAWKEKVLYVFEGGLEATLGEPWTPLIFDAAGNLYGSTYFAPGGFELTPNADGNWSEKEIRTSCCVTNGFVLDAAGHIYSSNLGGDGRVFELTEQLAGEWTESVLHNFGSGAGGSSPNGGLIFDSAGNLYGVTVGGGTYGGGTVFEITP